MYDINKRTNVSGFTVKELIHELSKMPEDARVICCGDDLVWLHCEKDGSIVCIDCEGLDECYDD